MKKKLTLSAAFILILFSCRRETVDSPKPQDIPKLTLAITRDSTGTITGINHYNSMELSTSDSTFQNGNPLGCITNEYNARGKATKIVWTIPAFTPIGYHWMNMLEYRNDTLPVINTHYTKGNPDFLFKYFYNTDNQRILDSNFRITGGVIITPYQTNKYSYDAQNRKNTETQISINGDTINHKIYSYSPNHTEVLTTAYYYNPKSKSTWLSTLDYTISGKILSEKNYDSQNQNSSQYDYTYDGNGNLLKKISIDAYGNVREDRYTNNAFGKPEKLEIYNQNKLSFTVFYYYE